jgi:pentatricopeptide repeat protein
MSLFRNFDRTSAVSHTVLARPFLAFLYPVPPCPSSNRAFGNTVINRSPRLLSAGRDRMDSLFIQALARAGYCPEHAKQISSLRTGFPSNISYHKTRRKGALHSHERREFKSTKVEPRGPFKKVKQFAEKELKALVDYYGIDLAASSQEDMVDNEPVVWNVDHNREPRPSDDPQVNSTTAMIEDLLKDEETPHTLLVELYKLLPSPGVVYLRSQTIHALLHHLSILERPTEVAMHRFLAILDDMKKSNIHIVRSEWTTAIYLVGRFLGKVSDEEVQSALHVWQDMEHRAGIRGGTVTMNVLFDIAVKSGKYTLAETFLREMKARGLKLHRHFRVSLLYYYGVMQNGSGVRKIYHEMVEAGDVIDTVVMNAVIAALTRAGEPGAAEHVFERMKRMHAEKLASFPGNNAFNIRTWRGRRALGIHLTNEARELTKSGHLDKRKELQEFAPIAPNSRTYSILIRHHARVVGDIDRVNDLLREMGYNGVPLEGSIFVVIFHGFNSFGGVRYSSWTADKLEQTWTEYLKAVDQKLDRTWISKMAVVSALKAFKKCMDSERTLRAWEEVRSVWEPTQAEEQAVLRVLGMLVPHEGFFDSTV